VVDGGEENPKVLRQLSGTALGVPFNKTGNPHLKPATKPNILCLTMQDTAHAARTSTAHQGDPLEDPLEQASPRSRVRASLEQAPSRSRGCAPLKQAPPRSRARSPSSRLRLARGSAPPSTGVRLARGCPARVRLPPYTGI
jgi:hypothetical protein